jgi:flagellar biosynthesis/type III secretory pathway M-ring protein FliF/YscJ
VCSEENTAKSYKERNKQMSAWKGAALALIFLFLIVIVFNLLNPAAPKTDAVNDNIANRYESYMNALEKKNAEYYKRTDDELKKASTINDLSLSNQKRFEKILERWEKQADQMDKVLARLEKNK